MAARGSNRGWSAARVTAVLALVAATLWVGCQPPPPAPAPEISGGPRLILLLVADQFRADYLERFEGHLEGGLRRFLDEGVMFADARHDHALTATAPGHATLATGSHPRRHGIIYNWWFERGRRDRVWAVDDPEDEESPRRLLVPTLGDWLKRQDPRARVYSASAKDRAAIFLGGHRADGAYWYDDETGSFVTSSYYQEEEPEWLAEFNERHLLDAHFGKAWEPLPLTADEIAALGIETADLGPLVPRVPLAFGTPRIAHSEFFYDEIYTSPWIDDYLGRFAEHLIVTHDLGSGEGIDLLALSFSAMDSVGHEFGPESREVADTLLRLDRTLGRLFEVVDQRVGLERAVIAFSADHGVAPLPELRRAHGEPGARLGDEEILCLQGVREQMASKLGDRGWLSPGPFLDGAALSASGSSRRQVEAELAELAARCPSVAAVWTRSRLLASDEPEEPLHRLFHHAFNPERSPDLLIQWEEHFVPIRTVAATHGSPYAYDTRVPMLLRAPGVAPGRVSDPVRTVDLAPTLAAIVGVPVPTEIDGVDLAPLLSRGR